LDESSVARFAPAGVVGVAKDERTILRPREFDTLGKELHVHSPLVFAAAAGTGPVDEDLAIAHAQ
jgi:hypothetical protein